MKPLFVLLIVFALTLLYIQLRKQVLDIAWAARIAMSAMLLFTAMGHFKFPEGMALMIPKPIPFKILVIYFTGLFEIAAAIGLLLPKFQQVSGWFLILFFQGGQSSS